MAALRRVYDEGYISRSDFDTMEHDIETRVKRKPPAAGRDDSRPRATSRREPRPPGAGVLMLSEVQPRRTVTPRGHVPLKRAEHGGDRLIAGKRDLHSVAAAVLNQHCLELRQCRAEALSRPQAPSVDDERFQNVSS